MTLALDPAPLARSSSVFLVDDHDEAYHLWKERGLKSKILLHFDAHIDFEWIADKNPLTTLQEKSFSDALLEFKHSYGWKSGNPVNNFLHLGNYLCRALQEGMIKTWFWIVPDPLWEDPKTQHQIWRDLLDYHKFRTGPMSYPLRQGNSFSASLFGVPLVVTSLRYLPKIAEPVLLNIDVDYLTTVLFKKIPDPAELRRQLPWIWPDDFVAQLSELKIDPEIVSIANSVQGGFTPIQYKFFGETLRRLYAEKRAGNDYHHLKAAFVSDFSAKKAEWKIILDSFSSEGVMEATRFYLKAVSAYENGDENAHSLFQSAVEQDAEFSSGYNSLARYYEAHGLFDDAWQEYKMIRSLLPAQAEARLAEAQQDYKKGRIKNAECLYLEILSENPDNFFAAEKLGSIYQTQNRLELAEKLYRQSLEVNPKNFSAYCLLAALLYRQSRFEDSKKVLRQALEFGGHLPHCYHLLAQVYFRLGFLRKAIEFFAEAFRLRFRVWQIRNQGLFA